MITHHVRTYIQYTHYYMSGTVYESLRFNWAQIAIFNFATFLDRFITHGKMPLTHVYSSPRHLIIVVFTMSCGCWYFKFAYIIPHHHHCGPGDCRARAKGHRFAMHTANSIQSTLYLFYSFNSLNIVEQATGTRSNGTISRGKNPCLAIISRILSSCLCIILFFVFFFSFFARSIRRRLQIALHQICRLPFKMLSGECIFFLSFRRCIQQ